ncbi:hypothetical protein ACIGDI_11140 [Streptomyces sp. NPDC085900]|uniref:hypothetical protein n=1 Tax=Streptomyces sp. NPDC085900 TaxID=3365737 RepID=UPI0037D35E85
MRGTSRGSWAVGLAAVTLAAGLTGCTGGGKSHGAEARAVVKACADGTFTWSGIRRTDELTGVSEMEVLGAGGGPLTDTVRRVHTPRPSVRATGPDLSAAEVLFSLGKRIGEIDSDARTLAEDDEGTTYTFTDVHAKAPTLGNRITRTHGAGHIVQYAGVRMVEGDFRYSCPGDGITTGHARNWTVDMAGILDCQTDVGHSVLARQAAGRSCEPGSPATRKR